MEHTGSFWEISINRAESVEKNLVVAKRTENRVDMVEN